MGTSVAPLTRQELARRILRLPGDAQAEAMLHVARIYAPAVHTTKRRDPAERRRFAGDPARYIAEVFGYRLTSQQEDALQLIEAEDRVLIPAGNNVGKTHLLASYGIYRFDATGALPDVDAGLEEQGCQLLLPGPDHPTVFATLYSAMLEHAARAERRGFRMPGERSENSVLWRVRPRWFMEAFSPPAKVHEDVAHTVSGRHHRNQVALIEEGQGVSRRVWQATEGMCSSAGNKIISSFNPTEPRGPAYERARKGTYRVLHMTAFKHPNVLERRLVIPAAVDFKVIDARVRDECQDQGAYPAVQPDEKRDEFIYGLAPRDTAERGARRDEHFGHPDAALRVYRPDPVFVAQVMGQWPSAIDTGLFDPASVDAAMERGRRRAFPTAAPDQVGIDPAREGSDDPCAMPRWGEDAEALLLAHAQARKEGPLAIGALLGRRMFLGPVTVLRKAKGPQMAQQIAALFPGSPLHVDEGGVGASVLDHLQQVLGKQTAGVSFSAVPPVPTPGEPWSENMRTAMYVRAARLVGFGLVDLPFDTVLREELLAHRLIHKSRVVAVEIAPGQTRKIRKPSVLLLDKDKVKELIGRSPDRADAFVLAVNDSGMPKPIAVEVW